MEWMVDGKKNVEGKEIEDHYAFRSQQNNNEEIPFARFAIYH